MDLYPHEQLMLLALRDEKGTLESKAGMYKYALAGALLSELALEETIEIEPGKKHLVNVLDSGPVDDPLLNEALGVLAAAKRRRRAASWVAKLSALPKLRHRIAQGLCRKGVLRDSEERALLFFTRKVYPTIDPGPERALIERLRQAIVSDGDELEPRLSVVLGLAYATGMLRIHFDRKTLRERKARLERIAAGDLAAGATREAIQAAHAAVIAATTAATVAATTSAAT